MEVGLVRGGRAVLARLAEPGAEGDVRDCILVQGSVFEYTRPVCPMREVASRRNLAQAVGVPVAVHVRGEEVAVIVVVGPSRTSLPPRNSPRMPSIVRPR